MYVQTKKTRQIANLHSKTMAKKYKSYIWFESWWDMMRDLDDSNVAELCRAINTYQFENALIEMTDLSRGMFIAIKRDIDENKSRYADTCAKRSESGKRGNEKRWHQETHETQSDIAKIANATFATENEKTIAKIAIYENDNDIINKTTTTACARTCEGIEFETVFSWLIANDMSLEAQLKSKHVIRSHTEHDRMVELIRPLAREYYDGEILLGTDFDRKGKMDTVRHFGLWLRKQNVIIDNDGKPGIAKTEIPAKHTNGIATDGVGKPTKADYHEHF